MIVAIAAWSSAGPIYLGIQSPLAAFAVALLGTGVAMLAAGAVASYLNARDRN
jgi:hypothetical protein